MHFWAQVLIFISFLGLLSSAAPVYSSPNQQITVKRMRTLVSSFLNEEQYITVIFYFLSRLICLFLDLFDAFRGYVRRKDIWWDQKRSNVSRWCLSFFKFNFTNFRSEVMGILTPTQMNSGIMLFMQISGAFPDYMTKLGGLIAVMSNNFKPFFTQIVNYVAKCEFSVYK